MGKNDIVDSPWSRSSAYVSWIGHCFVNMCYEDSNFRDKVGEVLETRLMRELDSMFIQSYVRLDCKQLDSKKVKSLLEKVHTLYPLCSNMRPSNLPIIIHRK